MVTVASCFHHLKLSRLTSSVWVSWAANTMLFDLPKSCSRVARPHCLDPWKRRTNDIRHDNLCPITRCDIWWNLALCIGRLIRVYTSWRWCSSVEGANGGSFCSSRQCCSSRHGLGHSVSTRLGILFGKSVETKARMLSSCPDAFIMCFSKSQPSQRIILCGIDVFAIYHRLRLWASLQWARTWRSCAHTLRPATNSTRRCTLCICILACLVHRACLKKRSRRKVPARNFNARCPQTWTKARGKLSVCEFVWGLTYVVCLSLFVSGWILSSKKQRKGLSGTNMSIYGNCFLKVIEMRPMNPVLVQAMDWYLSKRVQKMKAGKARDPPGR